MIEDFAADGVVYCELRTTPKARVRCVLLLSDADSPMSSSHLLCDAILMQNNPAVGMTKRSYLEAVLAGAKGPVSGAHLCRKSSCAASPARDLSFFVSPHSRPSIQASTLPAAGPEAGAAAAPSRFGSSFR